MLNHSYNMSKITRAFIALHLTIACIAFQTNTQASDDNSELTAEDYRVKGFIEQKKGNLNDALTYYDKALSMGLKNAMVLNDIGIVCEKIGVFLKAEYYYREAIELDPNYLPAYMNIAYLYIEKGFPEKATKYLKKRYELGRHGDFWTERAKEELIRLDPQNRIWINRIEKKRIQASSRLLEKEILDKARYEFEEIVETAETHYRDGYSYLKEGKFALAQVEFERALAITPDNPKVIDALATVYAKKGERLAEDGAFDEAIEAYDLSLRIRPNRREVQMNKNIAELERIKQKTFYHLDASKELLSTGDFIAAKNEIRKALTIIPNE